MRAAVSVGARATARAHAHALGVVPATRRVAGRRALAPRYAPGAARAAGRARAASRLRRRGPREHGSLRACRLPRVFVLNLAPVLCHCVRSLRCGGLTGADGGSARRGAVSGAYSPGDTDALCGARFRLATIACVIALCVVVCRTSRMLCALTFLVLFSLSLLLYVLYHTFLPTVMCSELSIYYRFGLCFK